MAYRALEKIINLYDGYCKPFQVDGKPLLLVQDGNRPYLLLNRCPHMDARMDSASIDAGNIRCPVHGIQFNLESGVAVGPLASCLKQLQKLPLIYEGGTVGVDL